MTMNEHKFLNHWAGYVRKEFDGLNIKNSMKMKRKLL